MEFDAERMLELLQKGRELHLPRLAALCEHLTRTCLSVENVCLLIYSIIYLPVYTQPIFIMMLHAGAAAEGPKYNIRNTQHTYTL